MCGIFGYIGNNDPVHIAINGLKLLEYRGYDSAGIAGLKGDDLVICKEVGKVSALENKIKREGFEVDLAIAHTRWATHGRPSEVNAHPHFDRGNTLAVIHNGIIENYDTLRKQLQHSGVVFKSDTDTEVIAHLLAKHYEGDFVECLQIVLSQLKGAFAIAAIHKEYPGQIFALAHECPLAVGLGENEVFVSSDVHAFLEKTQNVMFLHEGEIAVLKKDHVQVLDTDGNYIDKTIEKLEGHLESIQKGTFEHFMLKEIFEQPQAVRYAMLGRTLEEYATANFEELLNVVDKNILHSIKRILILGCGTSWHAGLIAAQMFEEFARIPTQVEISSEFRYKKPIIENDTLVIAISQSGETADTLAAIRELKSKGVYIFGVCNVQGSTMSREVDATLLLRAGPEISVCSTKAFTTQLTVLSLLALMMARMKDFDKNEAHQFLEALNRLPEQICSILDRASDIEKLAAKYSQFNNFFFIGRRYMYPMGLEAALKLKEITYINANGYPGGELKHGPIALIQPDCPTLAFAANKHTYDKIISNILEIKARQGKVLAVGYEGSRELLEITDDVFFIPKTLDPLAPILASLFAQLFAYYIAKSRGCDIDQPRNLAKSVTVE